MWRAVNETLTSAFVSLLVEPPEWGKRGTVKYLPDMMSCLWMVLICRALLMTVIYFNHHGDFFFHILDHKTETLWV